MGNIREPFEPETVYHVYNHGNADDLIFREDTNYDFFLKKYDQYISPIGQTYAYCLMPNHFHFMVRIKTESKLRKFYEEKYPEEDPQNKNPQGFGDPEGLGNYFSNFISHQFGTLLNSYTKAFNKFYGRSGSLFRNTFKRKAITDDTYYTQLIRYIHLNPVKHGFVEDISRWSYSSYRSLLSEKSTALQRKEVLDWFGGRENFIKAHEE